MQSSELRLREAPLQTVEGFEFTTKMTLHSFSRFQITTKCLQALSNSSFIAKPMSLQNTSFDYSYERNVVFVPKATSVEKSRLICTLFRQIIVTENPPFFLPESGKSFSEMKNEVIFLRLLSKILIFFA